jgi:hypothetical protein
VFALLLAATLATSPAHRACDGQGQVLRVANRVVPIAAEEFRSHYASLPRTRIGSFAAPFDIGSIDIYAVVQDDSRDDGEQQRSLHAAMAVGRKGAVRYYRLVDEEGGDLDASNESPVDLEGAPQLDIRLGTPNRALPILCVTLRTTYQGAHASGVIDSSTYIDFGFSTPRVIAETDCQRG